MTEEFLQFVWKYLLFDKNLTTINNELVEVITAGFHNLDSGPDFFNAKIKIGDTLWAGNVEIHLKTSDWNKHNHTGDKAYNNVILHVVSVHDANAPVVENRSIPTVVLPISQKLIAGFEELITSKSKIPCLNRIKSVDLFTKSMLFEKLMVERLAMKTERIKLILEKNTQNFEQTFYKLTARSFGFGVNAEPFEMLAKSLPLSHLAKHKNSLFQIEALLFGQAGFLSDSPDEDEYFSKLKTEYQFLQKKFSLMPLEKHIWKFSKLRPDNFPTVRIAQFAMLIHQSSQLFSKIKEEVSLKELLKLFDSNSSEYWNAHYVFNKISTEKEKSPGKNSIYSIIINAVVPMQYAYGTITGSESIKQHALNLLQQIPAEKNAETNMWIEQGFTILHAGHSQAGLQLKKEYCNKSNCLHCNIGLKLMHSMAKN